MRIKTKEDRRGRIKLRLRKRIAGTSERPRLSVFRSVAHIYVQVVDDMSGRTIASASITVPLDGRTLDSNGIVGDETLSGALRSAIDALVLGTDSNGNGDAEKRAFAYGLLLADIAMPGEDGLSLARHIRQRSEIPIIVLTGNDDQTVALSAVKGGAQDYLVKGRLDRELLLRAMHYSIERKRYQVQLEHQANYDALTGLPNRNLYQERLGRLTEASRRSSNKLAVVVVDVDVVDVLVGGHGGGGVGGLLGRPPPAVSGHLRTPARGRQGPGALHPA